MEAEAKNTFLIVGLGNPGLAYRKNRHNFGFMAVEALAGELDINLKRMKFKAMIGEGQVAGQSIVIAKPLTYMNDSGLAVAPLVRYFKIDLDHLIVIHDDLDLPLGTLRLRPTGGNAGQRGMASIINQLGTQDFPRMRLGIGRPPGRMDPVDYVLANFLPGETDLRDIVLKQAVEALQTFVRYGLEDTMNKYNGEVA